MRRTRRVPPISRAALRAGAAPPPDRCTRCAGRSPLRPRRSPRRAVRAALVPLLLVPLAACGGGAASGKADGGSPEGFPYTVDNCGVRTTFTAPPKRAVTMNQHVTEIMLALGLQDRMAGTAYLDDRIAPRYAKAYQKVRVLAGKYPSKETLLAAAPDFVYGGYASAFDRSEGRDRAALADSGIRTRLNLEGCTTNVDLGTLRREIREVGRVFGVPGRAEALIRKQDRRLAATARRLKGTPRTPVFVYDSGDSSAFTAGGEGIGNEILRRAGARNVFGDVDKAFADVSWEKVVQRKPEVVVVYDYGGTSVAQKKKRLLTDPALAGVPAVKHKRFAVLPLSSAVLGPRVPDAVESLARQLHPRAAGHGDG
ncbi:ABC transporter substrate-binding protein [Streptomyces albus subsp. chlorinus]|uniref:ABC transporter substrate-binding protein n=1 Tax=Streptomyces albus TaxID=1888 RepID=UPI00156EBA58|nr:ABC transporter substrate-binding protein [Streptomyces albus]NSC21311.1 ABC transporter substrate-binding protein [Streptomyces albus subsp. chlorinus]